MLTNKYYAPGAAPPAPDDPQRARAESSLAQPRGRMDTLGWGGTLYRYRTQAAGEATRAYAKLAEANGMTLTEMAQRWCAGRQFCTTSLVGHTSMQQLDDTIAAYRKAAKGPLPTQLLWFVTVFCLFLHRCVARNGQKALSCADMTCLPPRPKTLGLNPQP